MPVLNGEKYLVAALDSILKQTFKDFELLVLDDGSTDGTFKILQTYAATERRVRITKRPTRGGTTKALNELISLTNGLYVARMDADDIAAPERLALQVQFLEARADVVCVGSAFHLIDEAGRFLTTLSPPPNDAEIQNLLLGGHGAICHPSAMMRREALIRVGGYNEAYDVAQDLDLWLRLGEIGALANLPHPLLSYRLHSASMSEQRGKEQRQAARRACEQAWCRRGIQGVFEAGEDWRPGASAMSKLKFLLRYGWWAYMSRNYGTATLYGFRAIKEVPFSAAGWKLLLCAICKPAKGAVRR